MSAPDPQPCLAAVRSPDISASYEVASRRRSHERRASGSVRTAGRIRVAFCVDNLGIGGTELNAARTAEHLDRARFDLRLLCLQEPRGPLAARYAAAGVPMHAFPVGSLYGTGMIREGARLASFLRRERIDVLHCHDIYSNIVGALWGRVAGSTAIITSRRWWHSLNRPLHRFGNRIAFRAADCVLANSHAVATSLKDDEHVAGDRIVCVPNFVDDTAFAGVGAEERDAVRRQFGIPRAAIVLGIVARLSPVKDHETLLRAVARLAPEWPALYTLIVGEGERRAELEALTTSLGLAGRVRFAGLQPHTPNFHQFFDISVLCSLSEGFPNAIVEAMAAGRAIVATRVGGCADAVEEGVTGLLVPPANPSELAAAIAVLLADPKRRHAMGEAGRARARREYHVKAVMQRLEAVYQSLVRRTGSRGS